MRCPACQTDNPAQARFCMQCGGALGRVCARCGTELPAQAQFCFSCGQALAGAAPPAAAKPQPRFASPDAYTPKHLADRILTSRAALEGERKQVTVMFADLKGSMELLADRDPEEARRLLDPVIERMMEAVHRLARLLAEQGRRDDARAILAPVHGWFTEGAATADLRAADELLVALR